MKEENNGKIMLKEYTTAFWQKFKQGKPLGKRPEECWAFTLDEAYYTVYYRTDVLPT